MPSSKKRSQSQIKVSLRIKPLLSSSRQVVTSTSNRITPSKQNEKKNDSSPSPSSPPTCEDWIIEKSEPFAANVWSTQYSQSKVYDDFMQEQFLPAFEAGLNFTCFLYGQTGSGKTYTLFGPPDHFQVSTAPSSSSSSSNMFEHECPSYWGIFPRCISHFLSSSSTSNIFISMVELYQDQCYDLLNHHTRVQLSKSHTSFKSSVSYKGPKYDANGKWVPPIVNGKQNTSTVELQGQKEIKVTSREELMRICQLLESVRHTNEHALNARSSRSHCIVNVKIPQGGRQGCGGGERIIRFVDLAGSEKIKQTKASGQVLVEAKSINMSLSALGRVLVQLNAGMKFVSYRDSPLTVLLQDALRGEDSRTSIIVTVDSQSCMKLETRSSLNFAERCSKVTSKRRVNNNDSEKMEERRQPPSTSYMTAEERHGIEIESVTNALEQVEKELHQLTLRGAHGRNNPDFPKSTIKAFTTNKDKLQHHMGQLRKYKQKMAEINGAQHTRNEEEGSFVKKEEYDVLKRQIENENVKVNSFRGLVVRQMTTGVWIPPKQSYSNKALEKRELQKRMRRLNGSDDVDGDELFSTIEDLLLDFKG